MLQGFFFIFLFLALGNVASQLIGGWFPGNVLGMLMLFGSLMAGWVKPHWVKPAADGITRYMAIYFVPVGVGLMTTFGLVLQNLATIVVASAVSTVLVIVSTAWIQQNMEKWRR